MSKPRIMFLIAILLISPIFKITFLNVSFINNLASLSKAPERYNFLGLTNVEPIWMKVFGGAGWYQAGSVVTCLDGGFAFLGTTQLNSTTDQDIWLVRTNKDGNKLWERSFDSFHSINDSGKALIRCSDTGFAILGTTYTQENGTDIFLIRTYDDGTIRWNVTIGTPLNEEGLTITECSYGGFAIGGYTQDSQGDFDFLLMLVDSFGGSVWNQTYGRAYDEICYSIIEVQSGGFALAGKTTYITQTKDMWLVRTDRNGNVLWDRVYGGNQDDECYSVIESNDGGFTLTGYSFNPDTSNDVFLVHTTSDGGEEWSATFGAAYEDKGQSVRECANGGYIIAGYLSTNDVNKSDVYVIRTNIVGGLLWSGVYDADGYEQGRSAILASNGDVVVAGFTTNNGSGSLNALLLRVTDPFAIITYTPPEPTGPLNLTFVGLGMLLALVVFSTTALLYTRSRREVKYPYMSHSRQELLRAGAYHGVSDHEKENKNKEFKD